MLSGTRPGCFGPFIDEIREIAAEGLIEIRPNHTIGKIDRYWLTEAGRLASKSSDS